MSWIQAAFAACAIAFAVAAPIQAQSTAGCAGAHAFLARDLAMAAITGPDTVDDWRTARRTPGCRVTASGLTRIGIAQEAVRFYERLRQAGWTRTPDPMDAPNEASLRFRKNGTDCLFNVYEGALLLTEAELTVTTTLTPAAGETRYQVFAMCVPAMPAKAR